MGGPSSEREVSLRTGRGVLAALQAQGLRRGRHRLEGRRDALACCICGASEIEVVWIALHGTWGEDGCVQGLLECDAHSLHRLGRARVRARDGQGRRRSAIFDQESIAVAALAPLPRAGPLARLGFPLVVKPSREGSSVGVTIVHDPGAAAPARSRRARKCHGVVLLEGTSRGARSTSACSTTRCSGTSRSARHRVLRLRGQVPAQRHAVPRAGADRRGDAPPGRTTWPLRAHKALGCAGATRVDLILGGRRARGLPRDQHAAGHDRDSLLPKIARLAGMDYATLVERILALGEAARMSPRTNVRSPTVGRRSGSPASSAPALRCSRTDRVRSASGMLAPSLAGRKAKACIRHAARGPPGPPPLGPVAALAVRGDRRVGVGAGRHPVPSRWAVAACARWAWRRGLLLAGVVALVRAGLRRPWHVRFQSATFGSCDRRSAAVARAPRRSRAPASPFGVKHLSRPTAHGSRAALERRSVGRARASCAASCPTAVVATSSSAQPAAAVAPRRALPRRRRGTRLQARRRPTRPRPVVMTGHRARALPRRARAAAALTPRRPRRRHGVAAGARAAPPLGEVHVDACARRHALRRRRRRGAPRLVDGRCRRARPLRLPCRDLAQRRRSSRAPSISIRARTGPRDGRVGPLPRRGLG